MPKQGVVPSVVTYSACIRSKQPEWALNILQAMQRQGVLPSVVTYSSLISTCWHGTQLELAVELLQALQRQGLPWRAWKQVHGDWADSLPAAVEVVEPGSRFVPGVEHISHNCLKRVSSILEGYTSWHDSCKAVAKLLHNKIYRHRICERLLQGPHFK